MDMQAVLHNLPLVSILMLTFGSQFAFSMLQSTFSLFGETVIFADQPDFVEIGVGILFGTLGLAQIFTQLYLLKRLVKRFGDSSMIFLGTLVRCASMLVLVVSSTPAAAAFSLFLFAVGAGMQMPALQSLATTTVGDDSRGAVMGLYQSVFSLSIIFGSAIAGSLFALTPTLPYLVGGVIFAGMAVPALFLVRWADRRDEMMRLQPAPAGD